MNIKRVKFTEEERKEILAALKQEHLPHVYNCLMALKLKAVDDLSNDEVWKYKGLHKSSVNLIVRCYKEQGMEAITGKRHNHGNHYMTFEQEVEFFLHFMESSRAGQVIEVTEIYLAYQEAVGHEVTRDAIYYLLKKYGWRKIMPRGRHLKNIKLYALLPYTPELNPIEQIWEDLREKNLCNEVFITLNKVVDRLCEGTLKLMNNRKELLQSHIGTDS